MADLTGEYWQAFSVAWACFGLGVAVFKITPESIATVVLSRALLVLAPAVLSCWGVHACRVNNELATIVAARARSTEVGDVQLVTIDRRDVVYGRGGCRFEFERYSDGTYRQVLSAVRRIGRDDTPGGADHGEDGGAAGSIVSMPFNPQSGRHF